MRQVIAHVPGVEAIVIGDDGVKRTCGIARRLEKVLLTEKLTSFLRSHRAASLVIAATVLAATSVSETQAEHVEARASVQLAQAAASDPDASQGVPEQELYRTEMTVRGLAAAQRILNRC